MGRDVTIIKTSASTREGALPYEADGSRIIFINSCKIALQRKEGGLPHGSVYFSSGIRIIVLTGVEKRVQVYSPDILRGEGMSGNAQTTWEGSIWAVG